jgi:hypothetical protein
MNIKEQKNKEQNKKNTNERTNEYSFFYSFVLSNCVTVFVILNHYFVIYITVNSFRLL